MKYMLLAGEASGDLHASHLIAALKQADADADFVFLGGDLMAEQAAKSPVVHINDMAFMGFGEVIRHLGAVRRNLKMAKATLRDERPDALILVDYPSFNLKVAKTARKLGIPIFYYISPKVWAWKEYRVRTIRRLVERMYCIFPFEVQFYATRHDYEVEYVGNPTLAETDQVLSSPLSRADFLARYRFRDRPIVALLPGSRKGEIKKNLSVMVRTMEMFPQYRGVVAGAPGIPDDFYRAITDLPIVRDATMELLAHSRAALVTSGTATLESALIGTPQVACYRSNGSRITYKIMEKLLKVDFVTLPNLIAGREVIPEMLLHRCTPDAVGARLAPLLREGSEAREAMLRGYAEIRSILEAPGADAPTNTSLSIIRRLRNIINASGQ